MPIISKLPHIHKYKQLLKWNRWHLCTYANIREGDTNYANQQKTIWVKILTFTSKQGSALAIAKCTKLKQTYKML